MLLKITSASSFWGKVSWTRLSSSYKQPWIFGQTIALPMRILPRLFSKKVKLPTRSHKGGYNDQASLRGMKFVEERY